MASLGSWAWPTRATARLGLVNGRPALRWALAAIQVELEQLLGVPVDVLTPNALPASFRQTVLLQAVPV